MIEKSLHFTARIVKLYQDLSKEKKETTISKQIIRSGTSIGANVNEAVYGVRQADFIAKLQISLKEPAATKLPELDCRGDHKACLRAAYPLRQYDHKFGAKRPFARHATRNTQHSTLIQLRITHYALQIISRLCAGRAYF